METPEDWPSSPSLRKCPLARALFQDGDGEAAEAAPSAEPKGKAQAVGSALHLMSAALLASEPEWDDSPAKASIRLLRAKSKEFAHSPMVAQSLDFVKGRAEAAREIAQTASAEVSAKAAQARESAQAAFPTVTAQVAQARSRSGELQSQVTEAALQAREKAEVVTEQLKGTAEVVQARISGAAQTAKANAKTAKANAKAISLKAEDTVQQVSLQAEIAKDRMEAMHTQVAEAVLQAREKAEPVLAQVAEKAQQAREKAEAVSVQVTEAAQRAKGKAEVAKEAAQAAWPVVSAQVSEKAQKVTDAAVEKARVLRSGSSRFMTGGA